MELTKEEFGKMYFNYTNAALATKLGVTSVTIHNISRKLGFFKGKGFRKRKITIIDAIPTP